MKRYIYRFIEVLAYWCGLDALFYWLNRRYKRVVCFHNVLPNSLTSQYLGAFNYTDVQFRRIVRHLKRRYIISNDLEDCSCLTISFDDGYLNQYEIAARILRDEDVPGVLFVSERVVGNCMPENALAIDRLLHWVAFAAPGAYDIRCGEKNISFVLGGQESRSQVFVQVLNKAFFNDAGTKGEGLLATLDRAYPMKQVYEKLDKEYLRLRLSGVSATQLTELRSDGWLVGFHTRSHFPLRCLGCEEKENEVTGGAQLGMKIFAFPYGSPDAVDEESIALAAKTYERAYSFMEDPGTMGGSHFLPRMMISSSDKYTIDFELSGLKYFLKTRKLLPVRRQK